MKRHRSWFLFDRWLLLSWLVLCFLGMVELYQLATGWWIVATVPVMIAGFFLLVEAFLQLGERE